jgi:hypothetical protein
MKEPSKLDVMAAALLEGAKVSESKSSVVITPIKVLLKKVS